MDYTFWKKNCRGITEKRYLSVMELLWKVLKCNINLPSWTNGFTPRSKMFQPPTPVPTLSPSPNLPIRLAPLTYRVLYIPHFRVDQVETNLYLWYVRFILGSNINCFAGSVQVTKTADFWSYIIFFHVIVKSKYI